MIMEKTDVQPTGAQNEGIVITPTALLEHWQAHRRVTGRVIEAFPEDKLFSYSVGGMRPFSALALEMIDMASSGMHGVVSGEWKSLNQLLHHSGDNLPKTKNDLLRLWDEVTEQMNILWPRISANRFQEVDVAFGQWKGQIYSIMFYWIDNEIHHRGQGYVYLRSLGIEPPAFWDRS
jgi:uncharacterized damage-inducible protein DinB